MGDGGGVALLVIQPKRNSNHHVICIIKNHVTNKLAMTL